MPKPQDLIRARTTKFYLNKLDKVADILALLSVYIERRQVVDSDDFTKKDLKLLNEVMKINLDYDHITSPSFIVPLKKNAIKSAAAMSLLSISIKDRRGLSSDKTEILLDGFIYLPRFGISLNNLYGDPQSEYSFRQSFDDRDDIIFYKGLDFFSCKAFGANGKTWRGFYVLPYQYTAITDNDMPRLAKAVEKYELEKKKARSLAAKKAAVTRKKNKEIARQEEIERIAFQDKMAKLAVENSARLAAWDIEYRVQCADEVNKIKHDIARYIASNSDCSKPLFIDTETTDLDRDRKIIEISIVDSDENVIVNTLVNDYKIFIGRDATDVHGITTDDLENKPRFIYFEQEVMHLLKGRDIYFYNDDFDMTAIRNSASDNFSFECAKKINDVMYDFAKVYGERPDWAHNYTWQTLATACQYYGIEQGTHRALSDAIATCRVHKAIEDGRLTRHISDKS